MASDLRDLTDDDTELIEFARRIVEDQSDGYVHSVGAAVRDANGQMHGGINLYHFTGGPCAELVALATARANGGRTLETIVAVGDEGRGVIPPCGRCRQVLLDRDAGIRIIVPTHDGDRSLAIEDLLPFSYRWHHAGEGNEFVRPRSTPQ
jgi:cytidine deaminase